jgi:hypothetical protein
MFSFYLSPRKIDPYFFIPYSLENKKLYLSLFLFFRMLYIVFVHFYRKQNLVFLFCSSFFNTSVIQSASSFPSFHEKKEEEDKYRKYASCSSLFVHTYITVKR